MLRKILSRDCGRFWQFVKYGVVGALSTAVQLAVFYTLAATVLKCLGPDDWAVKFLGFPAVELSDTARSLIFTLDTCIAFVVSNIFCWLLNRAFVFTPGRFRWHVELAMFFCASCLACAIATATSALLIRFAGMMTTIAAILQMLAAFLINYAARRFIIFKN